MGLPVRKGVSLCDVIVPLDLKGAPMVGSTDVGDVSWVVPTVQARGATYAIGTPGHSWQLTAQGLLPAAHKGMVHVAKVMAGTAVDCLRDPALIEAPRPTSPRGRRRLPTSHRCRPRRSRRSRVGRRMTPADSARQAADSAMLDDPGCWLGQTQMTDPRGELSMLEGLPDGIADLCRIVQGVLIHLEWIGAYGLSAHDLALPSRETLSLADRLRRLADADPLPLRIPRGASARSPGTCRDFALMLCGLLRHQGIPARVRCGFAAYFREEYWEDHWICEVWFEAERRWRRADAQLDGVLGSVLASRSIRRICHPARSSAPAMPGFAIAAVGTTPRRSVTDPRAACGSFA